MKNIFKCLIVCWTLSQNLVSNLTYMKPRDTDYWKDESTERWNDHHQAAVDRPKLAHKWFPFMVAIHRWLSSGQWFHSCSGSIISAEVVLTSCQCIGRETTANKMNYYLENWVKVVAGSSHPGHPSPHSQIAEVIGFKAHPFCSPTYGLTIADVGLVFLKDPLVFNIAIQPLMFYSQDVSAAYAELDRLVETETTCYTPGWGSTSESLRGSAATFSVHPSLTAVRPIPEYQCKTKFCSLHSDKCHHNFSENNQVCVVASSSSPSCFSDAGGPLICNGYIFGVASWNVDHCITHTPGVFADIGAILDILDFYGPGNKSPMKWQKVQLGSSRGYSNIIPFTSVYITLMCLLLRNLA